MSTQTIDDDEPTLEAPPPDWYIEPAASPVDIQLRLIRLDAQRIAGARAAKGAGDDQVYCL